MRQTLILEVQYLGVGGPILASMDVELLLTIYNFPHSTLYKSYVLFRVLTSNQLGRLC